MGIGKQLLLLSVLIFLIVGSVLITLVNYSMRKHAIHDAEQKALVLLERNLATHAYFNDRLKPKVFEITDAIMPIAATINGNART